MDKQPDTFLPKNIVSLLLDFAQTKTEEETYQKLVECLGKELHAQKTGVFVIRRKKHVKYGVIWNQSCGKAQTVCEDTPWKNASLEEFASLKSQISFAEEIFVSASEQNMFGYYCGIYLFTFIVELLESQKNLMQLLCQNLAATVPILFQFVKLQEKTELLRELRSYDSSRSQLIYSYSDIVGSSDAILKILGYLDKIIQYTDVRDNIYLYGESGTGKSHIAKAIHKYSERCSEPFVEVNCGTLVESLCETELFGVAPNSGIFGAPPKGRPGLFELADKGFIFLDEIAELSLPMQAALLRVIEGAPIRRVCGTKNIHIDVRIISASSQDIKKLSKTQFMPELAERLNGIRLSIPSLRERKQDILSLIDYFCSQLSPERKNNIDDEIKDLMLDYDWPGNIRQLQNAIRQCSLGMIPDYLLSLVENNLDSQVQEKTLELIKQKIKELLKTNNKLSMKEVSQALGMNRFALRRKLESLETNWKKLRNECQAELL